MSLWEIILILIRILKIGPGEIIGQDYNESPDEILLKRIDKIDAENKNPDVTPGIFVLVKLVEKTAIDS